MVLSEKQLRFLFEEYKILKRIIQEKQDSDYTKGLAKGLGADMMMLQTIELFMKLQEIETSNDGS